MLLGKWKKGEVSELKLLYDMRYDVSVPEQVIAKWQYISAWQLLFPCNYTARMLLRWGTESNESTSSEWCASLIIFYLTSPSCSLTKKYKVHARHLRTTGEGVQSDVNGNISDNEFFECYVSADGPNMTTTPRAQCIWGMLLMFLRIILWEFAYSKAMCRVPAFATGERSCR